MMLGEFEDKKYGEILGDTGRKKTSEQVGMQRSGKAGRQIGEQAGMQRSEQAGMQRSGQTIGDSALDPLQMHQELRERIRCSCMAEMDLRYDVKDENVSSCIDRHILSEAKNIYIPLKEKMELKAEIFNAIRRLDILSEFLEDEEITEIMINGPNHIFVEKHGEIFATEKRFESEERLQNIIQQIVAGANRMVNDTCPICDFVLPDGSRVNVVLQGISCEGSIVTIRKFPKSVFTMEKLIAMHSLDQRTAHLLGLLVRAGYNIFISGGTGSGKTTFLNALAEFIPADERVITIEDSAELQIRSVENLVRLEARNANVEGRNEITIRDLIKTSLRMRPDRVVVGEVRDAAAIDMLQAMNTGHDGSLSTGHANSAHEMLLRLESMVLMGADLPLRAVREQICSALDIVIHLGRLRDRTRRVLEVREVIGMEKDEIVTSPLLRFIETGEKDGVLQGELTKINDLRNLDKLESAGLLSVFRENDLCAD